MALGFTVTVVDASRDPPAPTAVIVYSVVRSGQTCRDPSGSALMAPGSIVTLEAFDDDHVTVAHWPSGIDVGLAERDTVGRARQGAAGLGAGARRGATSAATAFFGHSAFAMRIASFAFAIASFR